MADILMQESILHAQLILRVDDELSPYDEHKLSAAIRAAVTLALTDARQKNSASNRAAGDEAGAGRRLLEARAKIVGLIRNTHNEILSKPDDDVPAGEKEDALVTLGFDQGELGDLKDTVRVATLAQQILDENPNLPTSVRVSASIINRLTNWVGILNANQTIANGGARAAVTSAKNPARDLLLKRLARARLFYCSCTDEGEGDPFLARMDFQPKRDPGDAQPQPKPAAAGTATFDAATRILTIAALPEHATSIRAWRQSLGGAPEPCGISETTSVSAADVSPFIPGVTYDVWVTGHNSAGDGPASNKIRFTA